MKRAICAGINDYPGTANDLQGCVNDANSWTTLLNGFGFFVQTLLNSQVTRANFTSAIQNVINQSVAGDVVVITYSGHGTQVTDTSGDEPDGYDEALYLYDGVFIDDEFRVLLNQIPVGVHAFLAMDSCFSGTVTRKINAEEGAARFFRTEAISPMAVRVKAFATEEDMKEILLSGAKDTEYSYDAYINGVWAGAMSYYATSVMQSGQTYNEFYSLLRTKLPSASYPQTPQLEGKAVAKEGKVLEPYAPGNSGTSGTSGTAGTAGTSGTEGSAGSSVPPTPPAGGSSGCLTIVLVAIGVLALITTAIILL